MFRKQVIWRHERKWSTPACGGLIYDDGQEAWRAMRGDRDPAEPGEFGVEAWSSRAWRGRAVRWLDERLAEAGHTRTGEVTQPRVRPWSTVLTASTTGGQVWFKATAPATAFEVRLYELFARAGARSVLSPIALDTMRGWLVLPDGGGILADHLSDENLEPTLARVLNRYGELQRRLTPHLDDLLSAGINDMRADRMPARFDEALAYIDDYVRRAGTAADDAISQHLHAFRPTFVAWCNRLASMPVPPSVDHNDLYPRNIFAMVGGDPIFFDWGDAVVAHPFASMLVALDYARQRLDVDVNHPALRRIRDGYLAAFADIAPHDELVETLELACRVAKVARVLTWQRALASTNDAGRFARMPLETLAALLDGSYLSGGCPPPA